MLSGTAGAKMPRRMRCNSSQTAASQKRSGLLLGTLCPRWSVPENLESAVAGWISHKPGCSADLTSGSEGKYQQNKMPENRGATRPCFNLHAQWKECKIAQTLAQTS